MLAVVVFGSAMLFKLSSFKTAIAAFVLIALYAMLNSYKNNSIAIGVDGKLISEDTVCIDGFAYKNSQSEMTLLLDANGSSVRCVKIGDAK